MAETLMSVEEAGRSLGKSRSTVWRMIQKGELTTVRRGGRRLIQASALRKYASPASRTPANTFTQDHPIFRLIGSGRSGGRLPGARDKHAVLDE